MKDTLKRSCWCFKMVFSRMNTYFMFSILLYQWKAGEIRGRETMLSFSCRKSIPTKIICQGFFGCLRQIQHKSVSAQKGHFLAPNWKDGNGWDAWLWGFIFPSLICLSLLVFIHTCYGDFPRRRGILPGSAPYSCSVTSKMQEVSRTLLCWQQQKNPWQGFDWPHFGPLWISGPIMQAGGVDIWLVGL